MTVVDELIALTKEQHDGVNSLPYVRRYFDGNLTPVDHYRQLCQLLPIYTTLEMQVVCLNSVPLLPPELHCLLRRSAEIEADLRFLEQTYSISAAEVGGVLPETQKYVDFLSQPNRNAASISIMAHFFTRMLADMFGGSKTKRFLKVMYGENHQDDGVAFYCFAAGTLHRLKKWMDENNTVYSATGLMPSFIESYAYHKSMFEALERTRVGSALVATSQHDEDKYRRMFGDGECPLGYGTKKPQYVGGFFYRHGVAAGCAAVVGAGFALALLGNR